MDNEIYFTYDPHSLFESHLGEFDLAVHQHCDRNCLYEEVQATTHRNPPRDSKEMIINQGKQYQISMMHALWKHPKVKVNALNQTFVEHNYQNKHLPLTDQFKTLPRSQRYVKR